MSRLIDADAIGLNDFEILMCDGSYKEALKMLLDKIEAAPTVEERKTGKWIYVRTEPDGNAFYYCSECGKGEVHVPIVEVKYCWNCG
ncbi:MAG: hypothetical protein IKI87_00960, partial [Clostridiales bacterium]|nr:hypothetical protein [Clostridiales bacterium]